MLVCFFWSTPPSSFRYFCTAGVEYCFCVLKHVHLARQSMSVLTCFWRSLMYSTAKSNISAVLVCLSKLGKSSWSFLIRSLIRVLLTLSAMLRGWVAKPLLARILQGTESWNFKYCSMAAISVVVLGKLNWWTKLVVLLSESLFLVSPAVRPDNIIWSSSLNLLRPLNADSFQEPVGKLGM